MDITVYLPDELGRWAKQAELNLSRMLRDAITDEQMRSTAMEKTLTDVEVHEVELSDGTIGRITGKSIADGVYLTEDERVLYYDERRQTVDWIGDPQEELRDLDGETYAAVADALGFKPIIDL